MSAVDYPDDDFIRCVVCGFEHWNKPFPTFEYIERPDGEERPACRGECAETLKERVKEHFA